MKASAAEIAEFERRALERGGSVAKALLVADRARGPCPECESAIPSDTEPAGASAPKSGRGATKPDYRPAMRLLCVQLGIPEPVAEHKFARPSRRFKFDFAWVDRKMALEVEGFVDHTSHKGFARDIEKYNLAQLLGWTVYRCTPRQLESGEAASLLSRMFGK